MSKPIGSIALAGAILVIGAGFQSNAARAAEECLSAPNARAPQGSHWHYRTDRTTQQKCWYLRSKDQTAQQLTPQDTTEPAPAAKSVSAPMPVPAPRIAATGSSPETQAAVTTGDGAQKTAQDASSLQRSAHQAGPAPLAAVKWPNPTPLLGTPKSEGVAAAPDETQADSARQQQVADPQVAESTQGDAQNAEPAPAADNEPVGVFGLSTISPLGIFLIVAIALAMAGMLSRLVMNIASTRSNRVYVDRGEQDWIDSIPPAQAPSIAARPVDLASAPVERVDRNPNELESALRRFIRERDRMRAA